MILLPRCGIEPYPLPFCSVHVLRGPEEFVCARCLQALLSAGLHLIIFEHAELVRLAAWDASRPLRAQMLPRAM